VLKHTYITKIPRRAYKKEKKVVWQQGHEVEQHGERLESGGWPHSLTLLSYCIIHQQEEASIWQTSINISNIRSFTTSSLMMRPRSLKHWF
jgi:hypothetical protein